MKIFRLPLALAVLICSLPSAYSQPALAPETPLPADSPLSVNPPPQRYVDPLTSAVETYKRNRAFARIWEQRYKRDISAEVLPFIDDPDRELAQRALRALGRLEKPSVLPELLTRKAEQEAAIEAGKTDYDKRPKRYFDFDTPIARIESRDLHGRQKIEFVLPHMKGMKPAWTWDEAVQMSKDMKSPLIELGTPEPIWFEQTRRLLEIIDMLYAMSKNGEDISELRQAFRFSKPQNEQLDGARLPLAQEINNLLDHSTEVDIVGEDEEYVYGSFLLSLGEPARVALKQRLEQTLRDKPKFRHRFPITAMLHAAARTGDSSYVPIFDRYGQEMTYIEYAHYDADSSKQMLQMGLTSSYALQ